MTTLQIGMLVIEIVYWIIGAWLFGHLG